MKEKLVDDYNKNMGFVNKNKVTVQHTFVRKSHKWTTKVAFHMIEEALFNSHVLYSLSANPKIPYSSFKMMYVKEIFNAIPDFQFLEGELTQKKI